MGGRGVMGGGWAGAGRGSGARTFPGDDRTLHATVQVTVASSAAGQGVIC